MGYSTRRASHYEVDIGASADGGPPPTGTIAGTVKDSFDAGIVGAQVVVQRGLYQTTTVAGGVYTFNNTLPEGTYEVVAKLPDAGLQAHQMTLSVMPATTTEGYFVLNPGSGCPTCSNLCSGVACTNTSVCAAQTSPGTCNAGVCMADASLGATLSLGVNTGSTVGRPSSYVIRYSTTNYNPGPDMAHSFTAPTTRSYNIAVARVSGSQSMEWYMTTQAQQVCSGVITYQSPWWDSMGYSQNVSLTAGQTIYVIVDGPTSTDTGTYTVTVN
jgi:hypothetical protein